MNPSGHSRRAGGRHNNVDVELDARHGGGLQQHPFLISQPRCPQQDRLPDALRHRGSPCTSQHDRAVTIGQTASIAQREGQLLHGEREPVGPAGHHRGQRRLRRRPPQAGQHLSHVAVAERAELDLGEPVIPAQQRPDGAQTMTARELIAAETADQSDRQAPCRIGQRGQQVEARLIRPLQVIEEQRQSAAARRGGQHRAHSRGQSRRAGLGRGAPSSGRTCARTAGSGPAPLRTAGRSALATTS